MNANVYATKDYKNETTLRPKKTKPIQTQFKPCPERSRMGQSRNNSRAPMIAIAFDYNGIFVTRLGSPGIICLI